MEEYKEEAEYIDCDDCSGCGRIIIEGHLRDASCWEGECRNCPVPILVTCDKCGGEGRILIPYDHPTIEEIEEERKTQYKEDMDNYQSPDYH